jgi:hypothetical protein
MLTVLIPIASVLGYFALTLVAARWRYRAIRPYTEPVRCEYPARHRQRSDHDDACYRRYGYVDGGEAVVFALLTGIVWPFILPAIAVAHVVKAGAKQLPEELAAEIKRLEAENETLRRQQEGSW